MARAPFQVLVLPYRRSPATDVVYAVFRRTDLGVWQGIAGGGEDLEDPQTAASREALEEAHIPTTLPLIALESLGSIPVEHFAERDAWPPHLRAIPEHSFGVDVTGHAVHLSSEHSEVKWLPYGEAHALFSWESNRAALRELNALLDQRPADTLAV